MVLDPPLDQKRSSYFDYLTLQAVGRIASLLVIKIPVRFLNDDWI